MYYTLKRIAALCCMSAVILTVAGFQVSASGGRESDVQSTVPETWSLPTFVIDQVDGSAVLRDYEPQHHERGALWNPALSKGQVRVGNRIFNLGDTLRADGTGSISGLDIQFGGRLYRESPQISRVHIQAEFMNVSGRPRTFSLRYVLSPHSEEGPPDRFITTKLPVAAESIARSLSAGPDRVIRREGDLVADAATDAIFAFGSSAEEPADPGLPLVVWPLSGASSSGGAELVQFTVSNRDRLLRNPWDFQAARSRDFTVGPGAHPDAAIGMRFPDTTLNADEQIRYEFIVYILHETEETVVSGTDTADHADADTQPEAAPAETSQPDYVDTESETETETESEEAPEIQEPVRTEPTAKEVRTQEAFEELNQTLSDLRRLQQRTQAPSREELDDIRLMIEALRQELDNLRRSDTTE